MVELFGVFCELLVFYVELFCVLLCFYVEEFVLVFFCVDFEMLLFLVNEVLV